MLNNKKLKNLLIIIPAFNEEKTIKKIIKAGKVFGKVLVVDDASTDKTKNISKANGAHVIQHKINLGYNYAIETGLKYSVRKNFRKVIIIDGDGQHPTKYIKKFSKSLNKKTKVVCGIRSNVNRVGEIIFIFFSKIFWNIQDPLCGMKGYTLNFLKENFKFSTFDSISTELLIRAKKKNITVKEIKIRNLRRKDKSRFGRGVKINFFILTTLLKCLIFIR